MTNTALITDGFIAGNKYLITDGFDVLPNYFDSIGRYGLMTEVIKDQEKATQTNSLWDPLYWEPGMWNEKSRMREIIRSTEK